MFATTRVHVLRLIPNEDLLDSLFKYARAIDLKAASVVSVVGSLSTANIRYANQSNGTRMDGYFEIVSVVGNIDFQHDYPDEATYEEGSGHIHLSISDESGVTIGGHMLQGNLVYTTAEITMLEIVHGRFERKLDPPPKGSGYPELKVYHDLSEVGGYDDFMDSYY